MNDNLILMTDSYKMSHFLQYPKGSEYVNSYIESRGGKWDETVFFGLQIFLKEYLSKPITFEMILEAQDVCNLHGEPFNMAGWIHILKKHKGYLPLRIEAIPEGTVIGTKQMLVQLVNTDPMVPWLTSIIETPLLRAIWYGTTVSSNSYASKKVIYKALQETADDPNSEIDFKMHDFGARGVSSAESAGIGGCAHLVNFKGTDTIEGLLVARKYYGEKMAGFSIPASEHSTITSWGREGELDAYRNMIKVYGGKGKLLSIVSDSYDIYNAVANMFCDELLDEIKATGGTVVIRPDSGDPAVVPVVVIELLMKKVGYTVNSKGYKVLPDYFRVIQGDGINVDTIKTISDSMTKLGLSASNIAYGQGGGLLQQIDRDTLKFAMKASAICINGVWKDVYKDPVTDTGKRSKRGRLALMLTVVDGKDVYETVRKEEAADHPGVEVMQEVFNNGKLVNLTTFEEVRKRANKQL